MKFGGTSVAGAEQWKAIAALASGHLQNGDRVLLVCSAIAGMTDKLTELAGSAANPDEIISEILSSHQSLALDLGVDASDLISEAGTLLESKVSSLQQKPKARSKASLLAIGEWLSSKLGHLYLSESLDIDWVDAKDALITLPEAESESGRAWLSASCEAGPDRDLQRRWSDKATVLITQGFVASTEQGETALLGRGGSDTSAALFAGRLSAIEVEIWTDVPGLFSANPSMVPDARLLNELTYSEALEMTASGARVVHPRCIRAAADAGISITIRDIKRRKIAGTRISGSASALVVNAPVSGIKAVTCQDQMLVLLLENLDARQQVGFLAWVFGVFSALGISIDLVATSETTTTVAINYVDNSLDESLIDALSSELIKRCKLRLFKDCCCVNLVGRGARTALSQLGPAMGGFKEWPLLMLSQSANDMCISLLVHPDHAATLVNELHSCLIEEGEFVNNGQVYGPKWSDLKLD
jgi:diaminopimelate decarboxylase/aspartate kinase